jgi:hypothetical protein
MGTRGTITLRYKGQTIRMYNHWDSYLEGLGDDLREELVKLLTLFTIDEIGTMILNVEKIDTDGDRIPTQEEVKKLEKWTDLTVSNRSTLDWYCLLRKTQGSIIETLKAGYASHVEEDCCEHYNYVIDFDNLTFSVNDKMSWRLDLATLSNMSFKTIEYGSNSDSE